MMAKGQKKGSRERMERKTVEKNRRMHMKRLCFTLASLVPGNDSHAAAAKLPKEDPTPIDQLEDATAYIRTLQAHVDDLTRRKQQAALAAGVPVDDLARRKQQAALAAGVPVDDDANGNGNGRCSNGQVDVDKTSIQQQEPLPLVDVRAVDTVLEVVLVSPVALQSCRDNNATFLLFYRVIAELEEHGTKVANAGFSVVKDKMFCTIHAQVMDPAASMVQVSVAVTERLTKLVYDNL